jgi:shikimate kinase
VAIRAIVLVGMRASGKTTLGRALAARLGWPLRDSDEVLAAAVGRPAGEWLAAVGEAAFRAREQAIVLDLLSGKGPAVIATGGGAITIGAVRTALAADDLLVVWLRASTAVLTARLLASPIARPALSGLAPAAETAALAAQRAPHYAAAARLAIDTGEVDVVRAVERVAAALHAAHPRPTS